MQNGDEVEIEIDFESTGSDSPDDYDDERTVEDAQANLYRDGKIIDSWTLDIAMVDGEFYEQIAAEDLEENDR